jgi:hypothetical protein
MWLVLDLGWKSEPFVRKEFKNRSNYTTLRDIAELKHHTVDVIGLPIRMVMEVTVNLLPRLSSCG